MANRGRGDIRLLAAASAISGTGDCAATIALSLAVYAKTASAVWLSVSFLLTRIPSAPAAPLSGVAAALAASLRGTPGHPAESGPEQLAVEP